MNEPNLLSIIGVIIGALGLLIAIIKEWKYIAKFFHWCVSIFPEPQPINVNRRRFLQSLSVVTVSVVGYFWICKYLDKCNYNDPCNGESMQNDLVWNKRNGVVHHKKICANHLPSDNNLCNNVSNEIVLKVHSSKMINIATTLATEVDDELKEHLLIDAIKLSPTSTHLYSLLIKMWGKNKQYNRIHELLDTNSEYLSHLKDEVHYSEKAKKKYLKAYNEIISMQYKAKRIERMQSL